MNNYKPIALSDADQARMRDLNDKTTGIRRMIDTFVSSGERRFAELQQEGREMFEDFAKTYDLDTKHVTYVPSPDGRFLVPTAVVLVDGPVA